ncbi:hypothetical protein FCM35_KLT14984 [Carex littledalei]|uniref:Ubiquitin-like protease family profile domain-containing protein n=1 Tax=Carex littledalei TaxID=544730 RepID=A0A833VCX3_9POAL|nr:hypothetical protein FCM35_KLT14984 [Carex littledalei]
MTKTDSVISSFLLIMQTNNGILARIEFMVVLNPILLLILFIFDTYRRRSRSQIVKYILLAIDASSHSMILHTMGLMQSAPVGNNLFDVWAILLVALRFSINYITVYGLQEQGRIQWNMEFGAALASFAWAGRLNGTRGSGFKTPLWLLWGLQPLRVGYMILGYMWARKSYWQGRSSVLLADYMDTEHRPKDPEPEASSNKNESWNNSESKPKGTNPNSGAYDPLSMRGYQYLIHGETWQDIEAKKSEDKLQMKITHEKKLITLDKIWQCKGKLLGEWGDKDGQLKDLCLSFALYRLLRCKFDDFPLPNNSIGKTRKLLVDGMFSRTKNCEGTREENEGTEELQGGTKEGKKSPQKQGNDNDQQGVAEELYRDEKQPNTDTDCHNGRTGGLEEETKQLEEAGEGKSWSAKEQDGIVDAQQKDEKQPDARAPSQNESTKELNRDMTIPDGGAHEEQGSDKEQGSVIQKQQEGVNAEKDEDDVKEEVANRVFEITGTEISFLNDYIYSRFPIIFWRGSSPFIYMFFYITIVGSTCWIGKSIVYVYVPDKNELTHQINGHNIDVWITWGMLLLILIKETLEILIYIFSDWTKVLLISTYVEHTRVRNWLIENWLVENLISLLCKFSVVGRWHGKIDQYNFLEAYKYVSPVCNLAHYLSLGLLPKGTDGVKSKSQIVLPNEVKKAIVKSISSLLNKEPEKGCLPGGMPSILSRNNVSEATSEICELQKLPSCSHIILVWHIATSICEIELCQHYNIYLADFEFPSLCSSLNCCSSKPFLVKQEKLGKYLRKNFIVANSLSRYCAHLLVKQPDLLPDHIFIAENIFQHAVHEARNILEGCDTLQTIYKSLMREGGKGEKSENEKTILRLSARLGKKLIETLDEEARWKTLAGVWADLLVYMAPNSNVEAHKESLATGGELITHVWILLYHAGILKNSLVDQGDDNDAETPDSIPENSPENHGEENDVEESSLVRVVYQNGVEENGLIDQGRVKAGTWIQDGAPSPKDRRWSEGIDFNKMGPHFKYLHDQTIQRVPQFQFFTIPIPTDHLFHHKERNIMIHIQDIDDLLTNKCLNVTIIQIYMLKHWILLVIMPGADTVYVLDSNPPQPKYLIEDPFNVAYSKYRSRNVSFKQFKCPRQSESWECGYYVMNFMHDIIMANLDLSHAEDVFADKYTRRDIDNIRYQWGKFLRDEWAQVQNLAET